MKQELEEFETLLKTNVPAPNGDAKRAALSRGLDAFDREFSQKYREIWGKRRPMDALLHFHNRISGGHSMQRHTLLAATAIIVLGLVVLNSSSSLTPLITISGKDQLSARGTPTKLAAEMPAMPALKEAEASDAFKNFPEKTESNRSFNAKALPNSSLATGLDKAQAPSSESAKKKLDTAGIQPGELSTTQALTAGAYGGRNYTTDNDIPSLSKLPPFFRQTLTTANGVVVSAGPTAQKFDNLVSGNRHNENRDQFEYAQTNPFKVTKYEPVSTFPIDVGTSSYSFIRASLINNVLPQKNEVRIEELVNYFPYDYAGPETRDIPFKANVSVMPTPWNIKTKLIHIGIKGYQAFQNEKAPANLLSGSSLLIIAKDVKIQVEFNPAKVSEYHLIGYETRALNREHFNNDKVDMEEVGSGHTVTALYEIVLNDAYTGHSDPLRYGNPSEEKKETAPGDEYAFVKIRYKQPVGDVSKLISTTVDAKVEFKDIASAPQEARFATAIAAYGQLLRGDPYMNSYSYSDVINLAQGARGEDRFGYRAEFLTLVQFARHASSLPAAGHDMAPKK